MCQRDLSTGEGMFLGTVEGEIQESWERVKFGWA